MSPRRIVFLLAGLLAVSIVVSWPDVSAQAETNNQSQTATSKQDPPFTLIGKSKHGHPVIEFFYRGDRYEMEISANDSRRREGMGNRAQFLPNTGMIFVHTSDDTRSYWMRGCMFDIDLLFLDRSGTVVAAHQMKREPAQVPGENTRSYTNRLKKYLSNKPARYALEFPPGTIERLNIKPGEVIALPHRRLQQMAR